MEWILDLEVVRDHCSCTFIVSREYGLKDGEVPLCHLEDYLVEGFDELCIAWAPAHVKARCLKAFNHQFISTQRCLRQNGQQWINLLAINGPYVLKLKHFTHKEIFASLFSLWWITQEWNEITIFKWNSLRTVCWRIKIKNLISIFWNRFDHDHVALFSEFDFDANCLLTFAISLKMNTNYFGVFSFVRIVISEKFFDILTRQQRKFCKRQNRSP